jgi:hypothetical protein
MLSPPILLSCSVVPLPIFTHSPPAPIPTPMALSISTPTSSSLLPASRQVPLPLSPSSSHLLDSARRRRQFGSLPRFTRSWSPLQAGRWSPLARSAKPVSFSLWRSPLAARSAAGNAPASPVDGTALAPLLFRGFL